jgi:sulfite oxidase
MRENSTKSEERRDKHPGRPRIGRRKMLTGLALGGVAGLSLLGKGVAQTPSPGGTPAAPGGDEFRKQLNASPLLLETRVERLTGVITPNNAHFVRSHNMIPTIDAKAWRLNIVGAVKNPRTYTLDDLKKMPRAVVTCFIECSGNSRSFFQPKATGAQWVNGAISVAEWAGVRLATLLEDAGLKPEAVDIVSIGGDSGQVYHAIPRAKALDPDTIVAYSQNGSPLTRENGYPVRLVVPGWTGISHTKWLIQIEAVDHPFVGFYNNRYYVFETPGLPKTPVQAAGVKSFITQPTPNAQLPAGQPVTITGFAYSGQSPIKQVEISIDGGETYVAAEMVSPVQKWAWVRWQYSWTPQERGMADLRSRATDQAGNVQPVAVPWNRYGYGYNAIQSVKVQVV